MKQKLEFLLQQNKFFKNTYQPLFFRLSNLEDKHKLNELLDGNAHITVHDELISQLEELVKSQNPKTKYTKDALTNAAKKYIGKIPLEEYGVWVYYPWATKLIHLLDEQEFVYVRTNRNQYKITPEEEKLLSTKKIGVIGLSVGKAIALTIAMERICGEIRIADFDVIELSNLNRIQTGVQNFGVKKTIVVAREIAEIDPYLQVTLYSDGLTEENADDFFTKNGKLDICIEVCDGLYTKIFARQKAKTFGIPVVMNSSDRGTTDIERFDTNPELPLLHGLINHLDLNLVKQAKTNEEKIPYLLPMLGVETSSTRLKASMLEIEETITTWPQLASGVVLGGSICTDVCRRILLNQFHDSGRYFVDLEDIISKSSINYIEECKKQNSLIYAVPKTTIETYRDTIQQISDQSILVSLESYIDLSEVQLTELIKSAILAPSAGNMQPWSWVYKDRSLLLFYDKYRLEKFFDYKNFGGLIGLGAATENLVLKAHSLNLNVVINKFPLGINSDLVAVFNFEKLIKDKIAKQEIQYDSLVDAIPDRMTNRNRGKKVPLNLEDQNYLINLVKSHSGSDLKLISDENILEELKNIIAEIDRLFFTSKVGNTHFANEIRWNKEEVDLTKDGLDINTIDLTPTEIAGLMVSKNWEVTQHIKNWNLGQGFSKLSKKVIDSSSTLGLVTISKSEFVSYFDSGRIIERLWLGVTVKKMSFQPMFIVNLLFAKVDDKDYGGIEDIKDELIILRNRFKNIFGVTEEQKEIFFFRLNITKDPEVKSIRRNIEDVLMYE